MLAAIRTQRGKGCPHSSGEVVLPRAKELSIHPFPSGQFKGDNMTPQQRDYLVKSVEERTLARVKATIDDTEVKKPGTKLIHIQSHLTEYASVVEAIPPADEPQPATRG